ncbi:uncharacterized protein LOC143023646 [Oratosquilla oratoria]|uniref:uncharacterized protein LOC143023646 n=1 Tax=Oratosquilla oratoria TaxID=337810 RepID=UPI003F76CF70
MKKMRHCTECHVYVQYYDHHCFMLGICVGGRNYLEFLGMLATGVSHHLFAIIATIAHLAIEQGRGGIVPEVLLLLIAPLPLSLLGILLWWQVTRILTHPDDMIPNNDTSVPTPDVYTIFPHRALENDDIEAQRGQQTTAEGDLVEVVVEKF